MAGAGAVVAGGLGGVWAHEDRPGPGDLRSRGLRVGDQQHEVLGGVGVGLAGQALAIGDDHGCALIPERRAGDLATGQVGELTEQGGVDGPGDLERGTHEHGRGLDIVLGLADQVGGDQLRVGAGVGCDQDLRGPGDRVDVAAPEYEPLRGRDVGVARADDLVHTRHGRGPERGRGDGLGPADLKHPVDPGDRGRGEHHRARPGGQEQDLAHPHDLGGDRRVQYGGGVGRGSSGRIDGDPRQGADPAIELLPGLVDARGHQGPGLDRMKTANPIGGQGQRGAQLGVEGGERPPGLGHGDLELGGDQVSRLEAGRELDDRRVTLAANLSHDRPGGLVRLPVEPKGAPTQGPPPAFGDVVVGAPEIEDGQP